MTVRPGQGTPGGVVTASDHRRSLSGLLVPAHATDPLVTRSGILPGPGDPLKVRQNSPLGMSVLVNAGVAEIYRTGRGPYAPTNDAVAPVAITPAPGANSRWDLIYIAQADTEAGDANSNPTLTVATGTAIASPTKPYNLIPAGGYVLAEIGPILTSTTQITDALITNVSRFTAVRGTPIWVRTQAERDELTALASQANPITVERLDTGRLERNTGSGWIGLLRGTTGLTSGVLSSGSEIAVAHGLGVIPSSVQIAKEWTSSAGFRQSSWYLTARGSLTFVVAFVNPSTGGFLAGEAAQFVWSAQV